MTSLTIMTEEEAREFCEQASTGYLMKLRVLADWSYREDPATGDAVPSDPEQGGAVDCAIIDKHDKVLPKRWILEELSKRPHYKNKVEAKEARRARAKEQRSR